jgi:hypothetical protein
VHQTGQSSLAGAPRPRKAHHNAASASKLCSQETAATSERLAAGGERSASALEDRCCHHTI